MKHLNKLIKTCLVLILLIGCQPDDIGDGNGLTPSNLNSSFELKETSVNHYTLTGVNSGIVSKWNLGDGGGYFLGKVTQDVFIPDAGTYVISHQVHAQGGIGGEVTSKTIEVLVSDPNAKNIIVGGKFDTSDDILKWTVLKIGDPGTSWTFANGKAKVKGGGYNQEGLYQAVSVSAGKSYKVDLACTSTTGVVNTWFEVYISPSEPAQGSDYSSGKVRQINTWDGCGITPFDGKISSVGCKTNEGIYNSTKTETVYLVIKCGGENLKEGISIDYVELRAM